MTPIPNEIKEMSGTPIVTPSSNDVSTCNTPTISKSIEEFSSKNCDTYEGENDAERTLDTTYFPKNSYKHESCSSVDTSDKNSNFIKMHNFCCYHHCHICDTCMCVHQHHPSENKTTKTDSMDINGYHEGTKELTSTLISVENTENESLKNTSCDQALNSSVNNVPIKDQELLQNTTSSILTNCLKENDNRQQKRKLEEIKTNDEIMELKKCKMYSEDQHENSNCSSKSLQNESIVPLVNPEDYKKDCVEKLLHTENADSIELLKEHSSCQGKTLFQHESVSLENLPNEKIISSVSSKDHNTKDCLEMSLRSEVSLVDLEQHMEECDLEKSLQNTSEGSSLVNSENCTEGDDCPGTPLENENKDCLVDSESQKVIEDSLLVNSENCTEVGTPLENENKCLVDSESQKGSEDSLLVNSENCTEVGTPLENENKCLVDSESQKGSEDSLLVNSENCTEVGTPLKNENQCLVDSESQKGNSDCARSYMKTNSCDNASENGTKELISNDSNAIKTEDDALNSTEKLNLDNTEPISDNLDAVEIHRTSDLDPVKIDNITSSSPKTKDEPHANSSDKVEETASSSTNNSDSGNKEPLDDKLDDIKIVDTTLSTSGSNSKEVIEVEDTTLSTSNKSESNNKEPLADKLDVAEMNPTISSASNITSKETIINNLKVIEVEDTISSTSNTRELLADKLDEAEINPTTSNTSNINSKEIIINDLEVTAVEDTTLSTSIKSDSNIQKPLTDKLDVTEINPTTLNITSKETIINNLEIIEVEDTTLSTTNNKELLANKLDVADTNTTTSRASDITSKKTIINELEVIEVEDTTLSTTNNKELVADKLDVADTNTTTSRASDITRKETIINELQVIQVDDKLDVDEINPTTSSASNITSKETISNHLDAVEIDKFTSSTSESCKELTPDALDVIEIEDNAPSTSDNCSPNKKTRFSDGIDPSEIKRLKQVRVVIDPLDQLKAKVVLQDSSLNTIFNPAKVVLNRIKTVGNISRKLSSGAAGSSKANNSSQLLFKTNNEPSIVITLSSDSEESEEEEEEEDEIRIGAEFQAVVEDIVDIPRLKAKDSPEDIAMWKPHHSINSDNVHSFIQKAKNQYNYREDQALGLLFHHQYNFTTASAELSKYYMLKKNWSKADKDKFDKLIAKYRKNFDQIQVNMPHKTMREIIAYYYERKVALKKFNRLTKNKKAKPAKSFLVRRTHNRRTSPQ